MKAKIQFFFLALLISGQVNAQYKGNDFAFSLSYNYTTTAKIFPFPNSIDIIERNINEELEDIYSYSFETRYKISDALAVGLLLEYIESTKKKDLIIGGPGGSIRQKADEGFILMPIELAGYYLLPFSTEDFKFHMGGGFGAYIGEHVRKIGNAELKNLDNEITFGIHVNIGMDYMIFDFLSVRGEMRFRDPQFQTKSKYNKEEVIINNRIFFLTQNEIDSKINMDGITFTIGLVLHTF